MSPDQTPISLCFFFQAPAPPEIYTLSLHDALPISDKMDLDRVPFDLRELVGDTLSTLALHAHQKGLELALLRSEEHTSELQSRQYLVCRLLLEKKNNKTALSMEDGDKHNQETSASG